jgi:ornithine cyclodeaminase
MSRFISFEEADDRLDWVRVAAALAEGHARAAPEIGDQFLTRGGDTLLSRAAWIDGLGIAVKSVTVFPGNTEVPSIHGAVTLFEDQTGQVAAVLDGRLVTKWKTAADSLLGAQLLARRDAARVLVVGTGTVAGTMVAAYRAGFAGIEVSVWGRDPARTKAFAAKHSCEVAGDLEAAVGRADIISTATMATEPVICGDWLQPGQHLDLIGAFKPDMREADDRALQRGRLFVDSRATTIGHIGEVMIPLASGVIEEADILGDLYDLVPRRVGRKSDDDITIFKNGGGAHLDLMTSRVILEAVS